MTQTTRTLEYVYIYNYYYYYYYFSQTIILLIAASHDLTSIIHNMSNLIQDMNNLLYLNIIIIFISRRTNVFLCGLVSEFDWYRCSIIFDTFLESRGENCTSLSGSWKTLLRFKKPREVPIFHGEGVINQIITNGTPNWLKDMN